MLKTEEGRQKLMALKLCEIAELLKEKPKKQYVSMWESLFGHKANEW